MRKKLFLLAGLAGLLQAQGPRGAITGLVKDTSGAVVPAVKVTVANTSTGITLTVESQGTGSYLAAQLLPGNYTVSVEHPGFKRVIAGPIKVEVSTTVAQDIVLEPGAVTENVTVTAETPLVDAASGRLGTTIEMKQVVEMPLQDRNVFTLANLVPGSFFMRDRGVVSLGGGRVQENTAMLDGVYNSRGGLGTQNIEISPSVDAMQEFKVEVNNMAAEFGRSTGGVVNAVTRSGTNRFTGVFYEFLRNDRLDAAGWNADAKPPLRRNNFGASVGGPIRRNRTFFFYNLEALRERRPVVVTRNLGRTQWRTGDFSTATRDAGGRAQLVPIYDPQTGSGTFTQPLAPTPFQGNVIPSSRLDLVALKAVGYLPRPNRAPNNPYNQAGNWQQNLSDKVTTDLHTARADHQWRERTSVFARYIGSIPNRTVNGTSPEYGPADPRSAVVDSRNQHIVINATHLFSPRFFLNLAAGLTRATTRRRSAACCDTDYGKEFGLLNVPGGESFPRFDVQGGLAPVSEIGSSDIAYRNAAFTNTEARGDLSRVSGAHTLKFGANATRYNGNDLARRTPSGRYFFTERFTQGVDAAGRAVANTGIRLADFLLGRLDRVQSQVAPTFGRRIQYYAVYWQDDWRVTPALNLNIGLRYEGETPQWEVNNRFSGFNPWAPNPLAGTSDIPAGALGATVFAGRNGQGRYLTHWDKNNIAPRFGFAWRVRGSNATVVRGGYGLFYGNPYSQQTVQRLRTGFESSFDLRHPVPFTLRSGLPAGAVDPVPESELTPAFGMVGTRFARSDFEFLAPDRSTPYNHNYNLTVQHQVRGILLEAAYMANLARHATFNSLNLNHIPPHLLSRTEIPERLRRPWTAFSGSQPVINVYQPTLGIANYHALAFKSERRFRHGIGWIVSYTFSKWIDNIPSLAGDDATFGDDDGLQNIYNLRAERSLSTNHIPHRLVLAPIAELPIGRGRRWLNRSGPLDWALGGWEIAVIGTMQAGSPFGVTVLNGGRNVLGDAAQTLRADLSGSQLASADKGAPAQGVRGLQWLNPAAFAVPARFTHGNASRTLPGILSPGLVNFDTMLSKSFAFAERFRAQFRWEMFNALNTPYFDLPAQDLGAGNFGIITSAGNRRIMQAGLKLYW